MIKAVVIHAPWRGDRHYPLLNELHSQGLEPGEHYTFMFPEQSDSVRSSHCQVNKDAIRLAKQSGWERVLILEDDVRFTSPQGLAYFLKAADELPDGWGLFLGGATQLLTPAKQVSERVRSVGDFTGTHMYMVHRSAYDVLLEADENQYLDRWLGKNEAVSKYVCYPMVAKQAPGYSDNARRVVDFESYFSQHEWL